MNCNATSELLSISLKGDATRASRRHERPLRIAHINQPWSVIRPPVSLNGVCDSIGMIADEITRRIARSHEVIFYNRLGAAQTRIERSEGVEYRRVPNLADRLISRLMAQNDLLGLRNPRRPFISSSLYNRGFIGRIVEDLAKQNCDIVHIHNFSQFAPIIRSRLPNIKIVLHMNCQWLTQLDRAMIERNLSSVDLVLGCSDFIAASVRRRFPSLTERCSHIFNGVDITPFVRPDDVVRKPKTILFVGRVSPEKGVHTLLDAFKLVLAHHPDAHLELIGPDFVPRRDLMLDVLDDPHIRAIAPYFRAGAYAQLLQAKIAALPPGSVSFFNKGMPFAQIVPHYQSATVFTFPSVWEEPFGMPMVEAMASRTPVVATRGGAFPEIVEHGKSGLLVERTDAQSLATAILQILSSPRQAEEMAEAGYRRSLGLFSWDHITDDLMEKYNRLMGPRPDEYRSAQTPG